MFSFTIHTQSILYNFGRFHYVIHVLLGFMYYFGVFVYHLKRNFFRFGIISTNQSLTCSLSYLFKLHDEIVSSMLFWDWFRFGLNKFFCYPLPLSSIHTKNTFSSLYYFGFIVWFGVASSNGCIGNFVSFFRSILIPFIRSNRKWIRNL